MRLLAGCTALEGLQLKAVHGFSSLSIVSANLRTIAVDRLSMHGPPCQFQELVIEDAPCLEILIVLPAGLASVIVVGAPKLTLLGYMPRASRQFLIVAINQVQQSSSSSCNSYFCYSFSMYVPLFSKK
jgi:hypothetical protein